MTARPRKLTDLPPDPPPLPKKLVWCFETIKTTHTQHFHSTNSSQSNQPRSFILFYFFKKKFFCHHLFGKKTFSLFSPLWPKYSFLFHSKRATAPPPGFWTSGIPRGRKQTCNKSPLEFVVLVGAKNQR